MEEWEQEIKELTKAIRNAKTVQKKHELVRRRTDMQLKYHSQIIRKRLEKQREKALKDKRLEGLGGYVNVEAIERKCEGNGRNR